MIRPSPRHILLLLLVISAVQAPAEAADDDEMYSHGVHSYFSGNLHRADTYLARAAELNPADPRPYYFRGLVLRRLGRSGEADEAMQAGAATEARGDASIYSIGEALQRVQGGDRLRLEQFRRAAKLNQASLAAETARRRYEHRERIQARVERRPVRFPLDALVNPVEPRQLAGLIVPGDAMPDVAPASEPPAVEATVDVADVTIAADEGDPFADDPVGPTAAASPPPPAGDSEAPTGSVKPGSLPGIFGRILGRQLPTVDVGRLRGMVPQIGGGSTPDMTEGFGGELPPETNPFEGPETPAESAESPSEIPTMPPSDEEQNPF